MSGYRNTVVAAACLGLVWLGDALIYVVLPLYPAVFGVEAATVGVLLAVNRIVRILGYGWVGPLAERLGGNRLTAIACAGAALSTLAYGVFTGIALLLIARLVWGAAYGVINLTNMAYAYGDGTNAGKRMGVNRGVSTIGPVLALGLGGFLVTWTGPQQTFVIYGLVGLAAVPLALTLPSLKQPPKDSQSEAEHRWRPNALNVLFFVLGLGADGVFTASLSVLLADVIPVSAALVWAGLLLAAQRSIVVFLAFGSGPVVDKFGARRILAPACIVVTLGLAAVALGHIYIGAVLIVLFRPLILITGPILAVERAPHDRINALASYSTWSDTGLALGPLVAAAAIAWDCLPLAYAVLAVLTVAALVVQMRGAKGAPASRAA